VGQFSFSKPHPCINTDVGGKFLIETMFDFINDDKFRAILERDFKELETLYENKASKSVLVITGSLIETVLVEYFLNKIPTGYTEGKVLNSSLHELLDLALQNKLISQRSRDLSTVIKDYRNLIHPGREIRKNETFNFETANVAFSLLKIIISELRDNYLKLYGYTAKDVIQKITSDDLSINIFDELIEKINQSEKIKLFNSIIEYREYLQNKRLFIEKIKPYLPEEKIKEKLIRLLHLIETGDSPEVLYYYNLFHSDINILDDSSVNLVTKYILSYLNEERHIGQIQSFVTRQTFTSVGKHIRSEKNENLFIDVVLDYYVFKDKNRYLYSMYIQLINSLETSKREEIEGKLEKRKETYLDLTFGNRFWEGDDLPF